MRRQISIVSGLYLDTPHSLRRIILLFVVIRYASLFIGAAFVLWAAFVVLWQGETLTFMAAMEVAVLSLLGPALTWVSSTRGETLAREATFSHAKLRDINRVIQHEIDERTRVEDELRQSEQLAVKTLEELKLSQSNLIQAEKLAALGELVAGVAHELNNPLTSVIGFSELLLQSDLGPEVRSSVELIGREAKRTAGIVQNLLSFARKQEQQKAPVDLATVLRRTVEIKEYDLRTNNIQVDIELAQNMDHILADSGQLQTVFLNLISNAQDAMVTAHGQGILRVRAIQVDDELQITVSDNGPGIRDDHKRRVFDPFFTTKSVGKGTGLGLSICHGIVNDHGGNIWVESEYGNGATFHLGLPVFKGNEKAVVEGEALKKDPQMAMAGWRILVIDDEKSVRELVMAVLSRVGYQVEARADAKTALISMAKANYDLLLVDMKMPIMSGKEFYQALAIRYPDMVSRVVFLTGDGLSTDTQEFLDNSNRPVITKPFELSDLLLLVANEFENKLASPA